MAGKDWLLLVGAIVTVLGSWLAARYAGRSSVKVAEIGVEEGAFVRAKGIYESAIAQLEKERSDQREQAERDRAEARAQFEHELTAARDKFDRELADAREEFERDRETARAEDRQRIESLERKVTALKARLAHEGIDVSDLDLD